MSEVSRIMAAEVERHIKAVVGIIHRFPDRRVDLAYGLLGSAIAIADSFGIDVEEFLRELRARQPKPPVLVPPKDGAS